ncbi:molybdate ABC transporter substrate-binding protein [Geoalkalibacter halelectricus]|uniref:Molybdate ABC transporter substrate-binding protein n=1 Tax=Geoalkalibacter halelectricus TaxID=2847045 RepID=A0ABY5ZQ10_9BACT|nr:molybdate ABC transporter substrate-binding protein [Geoalkalibacter halelectricus]MDO3378657.1 molybdate ABC transporter substrate-binding protein [Geoalkalibacter halelectricus]UWZ80032.1 molybdate ABC transporter substrate-binding protein [Geoalkalibacter halelectricus]
MKRVVGVLLVVLFLQVFAVVAVQAGEVRLSAAATLAEAMREISALYEQKEPEVKVLPNFGASGALARQIEQGAPVDLFVSANRRWMEHLAAQGRMEEASQGILASNKLVLVGRRDLENSSLEDLVRLERIAIVNPRSGPAGEYAEQALRALGLYERLAPKLVMAQDVRQAVVYADRGEVAAALVYKTDALLARQAKILYEVSPELHDEIAYPLALTVSGAGNPAAVAFLAFLQGPEARQVLEKYGFLVAP